MLHVDQVARYYFVVFQVQGNQAVTWLQVLKDSFESQTLQAQYCYAMETRVPMYLLDGGADATL